MNPRNSGQLIDPDGHSEVGSPQCGDAMILDIQIDDEDRINEIRFMTFGCAGAIAAASALTEIAKGKTLEEALKIRNSQIVDFLGGMPEEKYHCSVMGHEALSSAIDDFNKRRDSIQIHLDAILNDKPDDLAAAADNGKIELIHIHPNRVRIAISGGNTEDIKVLLERELLKRTGRQVEVRVIR